MSARKGATSALQCAQCSLRQSTRLEVTNVRFGESSAAAAKRYGSFQAGVGPRRQEAIRRSNMAGRRYISTSVIRYAQTLGSGERGSKRRKVDMEDFPPERLRNLSIIAHIDHGKSTLADRLLQMTGTLPETSNPQFLDKLKVERDRGITVKAQTVSIVHTHKDGQKYLINLIDTPGHVDFSYEVSRSLGACEGGLLLVDCTQGIQAQTLSVFHHAQEAKLVLLPVINKVDLPHASPAETSTQIESSLGLSKDNHMMISAKSGLGVDDVLSNIIERLPSPRKWKDDDGKLRGLVFDTFYDQFRGVVSLIRVMSGSIQKGDKVRFLQADRKYEILEVGIQNPDEVAVDILKEGQVGYVVCNMKNSDEAFIGDTVCWADKIVEPLPGFKPMKAMVYAGVFPVDSGDFAKLEEAIERLTLNDRSVSIQRESSAALSQGFRLGFLGTLHMDVFRQRLEDEYDSEVIVTAPTVPYKVVYRDGSQVYISNPAEFPETTDPKARVVHVEEPMVYATIFVPNDYIGEMMELCNKYRGVQEEYRVLDTTDRAILRYQFPLAEIVTDFFSELKSASSGFASFDYEEAGYLQSDLVKLNLMLNGKPVDALAMIVHRSAAQSIGRQWTKKLKEVLPKQMFELAIQAAIGGKVLARETLSANRKDVTAGLYGGHYERKLKHLNKQKEGKKRLKRLAGNIDVPQSAFFQVLSSRPRRYSTSTHPGIRRRMSTLQQMSPSLAQQLDLNSFLPSSYPQDRIPAEPMDLPASDWNLAPLPPKDRSKALSAIYKLLEDDSPNSIDGVHEIFRDLFLRSSSQPIFTPSELRDIAQSILQARNTFKGGRWKINQTLLAIFAESRSMSGTNHRLNGLKGLEMALLTSVRTRKKPSARDVVDVEMESGLILKLMESSGDEARKEDVLKSTINYSLYLAALRGDTALYEKIWSQLEQNDLDPDEWTMLTQLMLLQNLEQTGTLITKYNDFISTHQVLNPIILLNYVLWCLGKSGHWGIISPAYLQLRPGENILPNLGKGNAQLVIPHDLRPSRVTYSLMIRTLTRVGHFGPPLTVLKHMMEDGYSPNVPEMTSFFGGFARFGVIQPTMTLGIRGDAINLFPSIETFQGDPNSEIGKCQIAAQRVTHSLKKAGGKEDIENKFVPTDWDLASLEEIWNSFINLHPDKLSPYAPSPKNVWTALMAWNRVTNGDIKAVQRAWIDMRGKFSDTRLWYGWREDARIRRLVLKLEEGW